MLHHLELGNGIPVVMIHGMAASLHDWDSLQPALAGSGWRALAVDLLGHGDSPKPVYPDAYTIAALINSLEDWIDSLFFTKPIYLIGHSLGGFLSLEYSLHHPKHVAGLVLINPLYKPGQLYIPLSSLRHFVHIGERLLEQLPLDVAEWWAETIPLFLEGIPPDLRRSKGRDLKRASPHILQLAQYIPDLSSRLYEIKCDVLLIWGETDRILDHRSFPELACLLPHARCCHIPACGHQAHLICPQEVEEVVLEFLKDTGKINKT